MSSSDILKYKRMEERLSERDLDRWINQPQTFTVGGPQPTYQPPHMELADSAYETIRQIVREEIANAFCVHQQQEIDLLLEAVQGEPDPDDEIVAILAEMSESEWEAVVQKVKEMKEEIVEAQQQ